MFSYILWGLIVFILLLVIRNIFRGIVLGVMYVGLIFFAIFLLDTVTPFPLREIVSLDWYDKTIEEPVDVVKDQMSNVKDVGEKAAGIVNKAGQGLDIRYGSDFDKEWRVEEGGKDSENVEDVLTVAEELDKSYRTRENENIFIAYKDVKKAISAEFKELSEDDKDLMMAMTSVYKTRFKGKEIEVWNSHEQGDKGILVKWIETKED